MLRAVDASTGRALASLRSGTKFGWGDAPSDVVVAGRSAWLLLPSEQRLLRVDTRTHQLTRALQAAVGSAVASRGGQRLRLGGAGRRPGAGAHLDRERAAGALPARPLAVFGSRGRRPLALGGQRGRDGEGRSRERHRRPSHPVRRQRQDDLRRRRAVVARGSRRPAEARPGDRPRAGADRPARHRQRRRGRRRARLGVGRPGRRRLRARRAGPPGAAHARGRRRPGADLVRRRPALGREQRRGAVTSLDPRSGARRRLACGRNPTAAAYGDGVVWTGTVPEPPPLPPAGGPELRLSLPGRYLTLDPAVSHSTADEQLETATCAGLLAYPDTDGPAGKQLRPEVAAAMPQRLRRRPHVHLPHPRRLPLLAAVERAGDGGDVQAHARAGVLAEARPRRARPERGARDRRGSRRSSPARPGTSRGSGRAATCSRSRSCKPSGDFLARISLPHLCPVPLSVPIRPTVPDRPLPSSGPYYVSSAADGAIVLLPNPGYGGSRPQTLGADRLHARHPDLGRRRARRPRRARLPPAGLRHHDSLLGAGACSTAATGRRARPRSTGGQRYFPTTGSVRRLHRAQREPPALPRRAAPACGQLRARPADARGGVPRQPGDQIVTAGGRRLPGRRGLSRRRARPRDRATARGRPASAAPSSPTARSSLSATTACAPSRRS